MVPYNFEDKSHPPYLCPEGSGWVNLFEGSICYTGVCSHTTMPPSLLVCFPVSSAPDLHMLMYLQELPFPWCFPSFSNYPSCLGSWVPPSGNISSFIINSYGTWSTCTHVSHGTCPSHCTGDLNLNLNLNLSRLNSLSPTVQEILDGRYLTNLPLIPSPRMCVVHIRVRKAVKDFERNKTLWSVLSVEFWMLFRRLCGVDSTYSASFIVFIYLVRIQLDTNHATKKKLG